MGSKVSRNIQPSFGGDEATQRALILEVKSLEYVEQHVRLSSFGIENRLNKCYERRAVCGGHQYPPLRGKIPGPSGTLTW